jgi:glyoxalase family protein
VDFYAGLLGLRFVKKTVNFDDPGSYHLYYGDELGRPGTCLTFFVWPGANGGRQGAGQVTTTAFAVPAGALGWWAERLGSAGVAVEPAASRLDERVLAFADPDGIRLELVEPATADPREPWAGAGIPAERGIHGFHSVALTVHSPEATVRLLTDTLRFRAAGSEGGRDRFATGQPGGLVDVLARPGVPAGDTAAPGTVHHVAWRTPDDDQQLEWRAAVVAAGHDVTPVLDRQYFHSIYFREPGGVLFEIATDTPGFTVDEPADRLGTSLRLPPRLEPLRHELEQRLPGFTVPAA